MQPNQKDVEKVGATSEEDTLIKSAVEKDTEITKDDAKTIQDEKDVLIEVPKAATEKELKEAIFDSEKDYGVVKKVRAASEEGTLIKSTVEKATEISKDHVITIQNEKDILMEVPIAASDRGLEVVIDIEKEYGAFEAMEDSSLKLSLIF